MAMRTIQTGQNSSAAENRLLQRGQVRRACLFMDLVQYIRDLYSNNMIIVIAWQLVGS
jgi:hypothetical protein